MSGAVRSVKNKKSNLASADARLLQEELSAALAGPATAAEPVHAVPAEPPPAPTLEQDNSPEVGPPIERRKTGSANWMGRLTKSLVAVAVLVAVVWAPLSVIMQPASVEAVVNARLIVLRSPIDGRVDGLRLEPGASTDRGETFIELLNPLVDRQPAEVVQQQIEAQGVEQATLAMRLGNARRELQTLDAQLSAYTAARTSVLDIDVAILDQQITAERERQKIAASELRRAELLKSAGVVALATTERLVGGTTISGAALQELTLRRERLIVERDALNRGVFVGDNYNDRPQSAQRRADVVQQIAALEADLAATKARENSLRQSHGRLSAQIQGLSSARIAIPRQSKVWEALVTPGEEVSKGQELARLLPCSENVITAAVSETVYNRLYAGMPAQFTPRGTHDALLGHIVHLTGIAGASSNYAIEPSALGKEPYRVTIAVPGLANKMSCTIGHTGQVIFGDPSDSSYIQQALSKFRSLIR